MKLLLGLANSWMELPRARLLEGAGTTPRAGPSRLSSSGPADPAADGRASKRERTRMSQKVPGVCFSFILRKFRHASAPSKNGPVEAAVARAAQKSARLAS